MTQTLPEAPQPPRAERTAWAHYVAPMALFMAFVWAEGRAGAAYPWVYAAKIVAVTAALLALRASWREIRPGARVLLPAVLVGLAVFAEWALVERWVPYPHLGSRTGYDPFAAIPHPVGRLAFLAVRLYGLALLVPVMEEVFWRSFLLRYVTKPDWTSVRLGDYSAGAFIVVAGLFALAHPEWLAAVICACAYAWLLRSTRSLFACIVAHAVTNAALGAYVLATGTWSLW